MDQPEPLRPMAENAVAVHEVFESLVHAGFTREEALELVKVQLWIASGLTKEK